jgi:hypothetical protein
MKHVPYLFPMKSVLKSSGQSGASTPSPALTSPTYVEVEMADRTPIIAAIFWSKVDIPADQAGCWRWTQTTNENGYGRFWNDGGWRAAHRFAYRLVKGPIPDGLQVRHMCHNRLCCNPEHLDIGTAKDNAQDAIDAGRFTRGSANGNAKVNDTIAAYIRLNPDKLTGRQLAEKFGVSPATVSGVRNMRIWRHTA